MQLQHLARNRVVCRAKFLQICGKVVRFGADNSINGVPSSTLPAGQAGIRQPAARANECAEEPNDCSGALYLMCASLATKSTATDFSLSSRPVFHLNQSQPYFFGVLRKSCYDLICRVLGRVVGFAVGDVVQV